MIFSRQTRKHVFVATKHVFWSDESMLVTRQVLSRQTRVQTDMLHVVTHNCGAICFEAGLVSIIGVSCHKYHFCRDKTGLERRNASFGATKHVFGHVCLPRQYHWRELPQELFLRDKHATKRHVTTNFFVATKRSSQFCYDKTRFLKQQKYHWGELPQVYLSRQKYVTTKLRLSWLLSRQFSQQKLYLW